MKSLRYDSQGRCDISSYNIMGIAFNIPAEKLMPSVGRELVTGQGATGRAPCLRPISLL
jgi:hypothetical protein